VGHKIIPASTSITHLQSYYLIGETSLEIWLLLQIVLQYLKPHSDVSKFSFFLFYFFHTENLNGMSILL
jgi:hypothetical protein